MNVLLDFGIIMCYMLVWFGVVILFMYILAKCFESNTDSGDF